MKRESNVNGDLNKIIQMNCHHPVLKALNETGERVCIKCGRSIYSGQKKEMLVKD